METKPQLDWSKLDRRENLGNFLNAAGLVGTGVEVGIAWGHYSRQILDQWRGEVLYGIDPLEYQQNYDDPINKAEDYAAMRRKIRELEQEGNGRFIWRDTYSSPSAVLFQDNYLDFVYIDAHHDYPNISADLQAWWPKVKPGGLLCGHDYYAHTFPCGVIQAVDEFVAQHNLPKPHLTLQDDASWWIQKP